MNNLFLIIFFVFAVSSCKERKESKPNENENTPETETIRSGKDIIIFHQSDTIIRFHTIQNSYGVFKWGVDNQYENVSKDTFTFDETKLGKVEKVGDNFIFTNGCGTACNFAIVSKFHPGDGGTMIMYPLLIDSKNNIIVYNGDKDDVLVSIHNLKTGETTDIIEDFDKTIRPPKNVIESISINKNGNVVIEWLKSNSEKAKKEIVL